MQKDQLQNKVIYSKNVIEFATVAAETCLFLEHIEEYSRKDFISQAIKFLPLLYLKTTVLELPKTISDEPIERFVTEDDYRYLAEKTEELLGTDNVYLEVFCEEMQYSDTPIAAFISEGLADIYQEIKDFAMNYRMGVEDLMNDALAACIEAFAEHWGQKLLNTLRALHALHYHKEDEDVF